jgi:hypothetical protein
MQQTPKNLLSLSSTAVWQKPYLSKIRMIAEVNIVDEGLVMGSMQAKLHIPQQPIRYASAPSVFTGHICVKVHYQEWSSDRKIVDKF